MSESQKAKDILKQLNEKGYNNDRSLKSYERRIKKLEDEFDRLEKRSNKKEIKNNKSFVDLPRGLVFMIDNFKITT